MPVPALRSCSSSVAGRAIDCLAGKLAFTTSIANVPLTSAASWRAAPHALAPSAAQAPASTAPRTLRPRTNATYQRAGAPSAATAAPLAGWWRRRDACRRVFTADSIQPEERVHTDGARRCPAGVHPRSALARGIRGHDDPHVEDDRLRAAPAVSVWRRARVAVPVRAAAVLVPAADLDGVPVLRRPRPAGGQLPDAVRRAGPIGRLLRAGVDPRDRPERDRDRARRRGGHGHHR